MVVFSSLCYFIIVCVLVLRLFCLVRKARGIARPPVLGAIGHVGSQNPD
jgi:hypothetical protein